MGLNFRCFVGIDQTGAVRASGRPHPLPCAVLERGSAEWKLHLADGDLKPLAVDSFASQSFEKLLEPFHRTLGAKVALMVDCVFGLPWQSWRAVGEKPGDLRSLIRQCTQENAYGRSASEAFFGKWSGGQILRRECERVSGSNSVFQTRPFQKNIQTGTFRIWRDLALHGDEDAFSFWPFDPVQSGRPWVFEGYPSFYWRQLFKMRSRTVAAFPEVLEAVRSFGLKVRWEHPKNFRLTPDAADAAVLALAGLVLQHEGRLFRPFNAFALQASARAEGWIAGVIPPHADPIREPA